MSHGCEISLQFLLKSFALDPKYILFQILISLESTLGVSTTPSLLPNLPETKLNIAPTSAWSGQWRVASFKTNRSGSSSRLSL